MRILQIALIAGGFAVQLRSQSIITTIAGADYVFPGNGKPAISSPLGPTGGLAIDQKGNLYVADQSTFIVLKIDTNGIFTVIAGNGLERTVQFTSDGLQTPSLGDGGQATAASLVRPLGLATDSAGNVYIAENPQVQLSDFPEGLIRRVSPSGIITTVAGGGELELDGAPATLSGLQSPVALAADSAGNLYIADDIDNRVRKVSPDGFISTVAGNGDAGYSGDGGPAAKAALSTPSGLAVDAAGNLYIADSGNHVIRKVTQGGLITTIAGTGSFGYSGDGGAAVKASLGLPGPLAVDSAGNVFVADDGYGVIRKISPNGTISSLAGTPAGGLADDGIPAASAALGSIFGIAAGADGTLYLATIEDGQFHFFGVDGFGRVRAIANGTISTVAGNGAYRFGGDGGPATGAIFHNPSGVALDPNGNIFVADSDNNRIRLIGRDRVIKTIAGTGRRGDTGDGGPAADARLDRPRALALDQVGSLYFTEGSSRVRKISAGTISTVAGTGIAGFSGDGGPAVNAQLNGPSALAIDASGSLYITDTGNNRIRKVTTAGIIATIAGNGTADYGGDGSGARAASLNGPTGVAVDFTGNVYISDTANSRIRKVTPDGIITTLVGPSAQGMDTGVAYPGALTFGPVGDLFVADDFANRIAQVLPDGTTRTVAGGGLLTDNAPHDGIPATQTEIHGIEGIAFDQTGNLYIAETGDHRIREVLQTAPDFTVAPASGLQFTAKSDGPAPESRGLQLASTAPLGFTLELDSTASGHDFLRAATLSGIMPNTVQISVDPVGLDPGTYQGRIVIKVPNGHPFQKLAAVAVTFTVLPPDPPGLGVQQNAVSFEFSQLARRAGQQITVSNRGGGVLAYSASATTDSGGAWLSVTPGSGGAAASFPASLTIAADRTGLDPGTYTGRVLITSSTTGERATIPVTMSVNDAQQIILLSQTGLTFTAVVGGGAVPPQTFGILNAGRGVMPWNVSTSTISGGNWLTATPDSRSSDANSLVVPLVQVGVNAVGLAPGEYYGQVRVTATSAVNSPQIVSVVLRVLPAGSNPGPLVRPTGLIFTAAASGTPPGSQVISISNLTATPITFISGLLTADGKNWFVSLPSSGTVTPGTPASVVVAVSPNGLDPDIRRGVLTLLFSDGSVQTVNILFVLIGTQGASSVNVHKSARLATGDTCSPSKLLPVFTSLEDHFSQPATWPISVEVKVVDDCGGPLTSGQVVATFSNGDPVLSLVSLKDGRWSGSWQSRNSNVAEVKVTATAHLPALGIDGGATVIGGLKPNPNPPVVQAGGVVSAASFQAQAPLAPGSLISIFGSRLADRQASADQVPLSTQLGGAQVVLAGQSLPLVFSSDHQINAVIPFDIAVNTTQQLIVQRGGALSVPEPVILAPAQPAIFIAGPAGSSQGSVVRVTAGGQSLADPQNPAKAGEVVVIYCSGLGAVAPDVPAGGAGPLSPLAQTTVPVTVNIGGQDARVLFSGLAPGFVGLYQVNAIVPDGVPPGDTVPVIVSVGSSLSVPVTMAVR